MTEDQQAAVEQCDREAAASVSKDIYYANSHTMCEADAEEMREILTEAFARHRTRALDAPAAEYKRERDAARIEAAANAEDAGKYRRSKANLKQFRKEGV